MPECPARRHKAVTKLVEIHGQDAVDAALHGKRPVTDDALVALSNMWHERAAFILVQLAEGMSFTAANEASSGIYDTCGWHEIISRMVRARGSTLGNAARLARQGNKIVQSDKQSQVIIQEASQIRAAAQRLIRLLVLIPMEDVCGTVKGTSNSDQSLFDAARPETFAKVKGQLAQANRFVSKCVRDLPHIFAKTGLRPTATDRARIKVEAARTALGAELIINMMKHKLFRSVKRPDRSGWDRLGVGQRYSHWLDPLLT